MLVRVLYLSSVAQGVTGQDIERLVASSRRRNRQLDLTGALVACADRFAQVLEGRVEAVDEMMDKIAKDPRHTNMSVLSRKPIEKRICDNWDMAFVDDENWSATLEGVAVGSIPPEDFYAILLKHYEEHRSAPF